MKDDRKGTSCIPPSALFSKREHPEGCFEHEYGREAARRQIDKVTVLHLQRSKMTSEFLHVLLPSFMKIN